MSKNLIIEVNDNNHNNENTKVKITRNRLTKKQQFENERDDFINQLNSLIGIDNKKNYLYLYDLERNEELLQQIKNLAPRVRIIFKCSAWGYFLEKERGGDNPIGLMRSIYKDCDYVISNTYKTIVRDGKKINSIVYYFNKKNNE